MNRNYIAFLTCHEHCTKHVHYKKVDFTKSINSGNISIKVYYHMKVV